MFAESAMNCHTDKDFNKIELQQELTVTCSVKFSGNWEPSFSCHCVNVNGKSLLKINTTTVNTSSMERTYNAALELSISMNNAIIQCSLYFEVKQIPSIYTDPNFPDYKDTWSSSTINILCT